MSIIGRIVWQLWSLYARFKAPKGVLGRVYGVTFKHSNEWLDVIWKGKMVEINAKGTIRQK